MRSRPRSLRDIAIANNAADRYYAAMFGKEPQFQTAVKPKRAASVPDPNRISEASVNDDIRNAKIPGLTLYRNNRGMIRLPDGMLRYGVGPNGGSDWIGRFTVIVTPEMVGKRIAIFTVVEAKAPDAGRPDDGQQEFINDTVAAGGIGGVARSLDDLLAIVKRS